MTDVTDGLDTPDLDDLILEGYAREATLLARCDKAEAEVERLRGELGDAVDRVNGLAVRYDSEQRE